MRTLLQQIARGHTFSLYYFSPYFGEWRTDVFYVDKGSMTIGRLVEDKEKFDNITFTMTGVNPID